MASECGYVSCVRMLRLVLAMRKTAFRSLAALADRRVPSRLKWLALAGALFVISPLNVLGDIPLLGLVDDAGLLMMVLMWFTRASAPYQNTFDA
jgi:uncharacterized membrane protein YkvA (DUF1232 family)